MTAPTMVNHPITRFVVRRLLYSAVVLFGVLIVVFALVHLVPGDPVRIALGTRYTPEAYEALRTASGLDRPIVSQFFGYLGSALTGDLGVSFRNGDPVTVTLLERLPATLSLGFVGILIALAIALPAGIFSALREGRISDAIVRVTSQFGVSIPDFWMGILLIALFASTLGWLPTSGYRPLFDDPAGWLRHIILPGLTVGVVAAAIMTRYVRAAVLEVAAMGYVRTARSKGLPPRIVTFRHTVRNALVPILTITGIQLATLLGGVIVVEVVFAWPGLGRLVYNAVAARDYPLIQGTVLLIAALFLLINLLVDVLYAVVDPRIRLA
ncbi:MAG TPA: ABC transporter permease [Mycobacterium sp.]